MFLFWKYIFYETLFGSTFVLSKLKSTLQGKRREWPSAGHPTFECKIIIVWTPYLSEYIATARTPNLKQYLPFAHRESFRVGKLNSYRICVIHQKANVIVIEL